MARSFRVATVFFCDRLLPHRSAKEEKVHALEEMPDDICYCSLLLVGRTGVETCHGRGRRR